MRKGFFPKEIEIAFMIHGVGFDNGNPFVSCIVALGKAPALHQALVIKKIMGVWMIDVKPRRLLNEEECEMLDDIWEQQTKKMGVPNL